jgi:hypothetical protein
MFYKFTSSPLVGDYFLLHSVYFFATIWMFQNLFLETFFHGTNPCLEPNTTTYHGSEVTQNKQLLIKAALLSRSFQHEISPGLWVPMRLTIDLPCGGGLE